MLCSSNRLAIAAISFRVADDRSVSRPALASIRRAELAKGLRRLFRRHREALGGRGEPLVNAGEVLRRLHDQFAKLGVRAGQAVDQVVHAFRQARLGAFNDGQRFGGAAGKRVDQGGILGAQAFGRPLRCVFEALLQLAAAFGEAVHQRPRRILEDFRDLGGAAGQHRVKFTRVLADRLRGFVGALADMLSDR